MDGDCILLGILDEDRRVSHHSGLDSPLELVAPTLILHDNIAPAPDDTVCVLHTCTVITICGGWPQALGAGGCSGDKDHKLTAQ